MIKYQRKLLGGIFYLGFILICSLLFNIFMVFISMDKETNAVNSYNELKTAEKTIKSLEEQVTQLKVELEEAK